MSSSSEGGEGERQQQGDDGNNSIDLSSRFRTRSPWSGRRRHHGVVDLRDTGDTNKMRVVKDQTARREMLTNDPANIAPQPEVDTKRAVSQLGDRHITDMHDVQKRHRPQPPTDKDSRNPVPRRGWRK